MITNLREQIDFLLAQAGGNWGIVLEDLKTKEQVTINGNQRFFAASLIKVPIMAAVFEAVYEGRFAFGDTYKLRQEDLVGGAGVLQHMSPGTDLTIWDISTLMIIQSDNTATNICIDLVGKERIREIMRKTGMNNSQFYNKLMIVPADLEGYNEVTAADMANHFRSIATGRIISFNSCQQMIKILKNQQIRQSLPIHLPDPDHDVIGMFSLWELAHKTGTVTLVEHDVGILYLEQSAVILSVLSKGVEANKARDTIGRIAELVYSVYKNP